MHGVRTRALGRAMSNARGSLTDGFETFGKGRRIDPFRVKMFRD